MTALAPKPAALLRFIAGYQAANGGVSPSVRECARGIGCAPAKAHQLLRGLEERGAIRRLPHRERAIDVLEPVAIPMVDGVPLFAVPLRASSFLRYSGERV